MKWKIIVLAAIAAAGISLGAADAQAVEGSQCLLSTADQYTFNVKGDGFPDGIMKLILQVVHELGHLVAKVVCSIINEFGVQCRG
jgi:hypothetical protein